MVRKGGEVWGVWGLLCERGRFSKERSNEAALSLRSRRNGTKFANPASCGFAY